MSAMHSTGERLRRATQLWHAYLAGAGVRFDLARFVNDPVLERQVLDGALASGDPRLRDLAQAWMRDTAQVPPAAVAPGAAPPAAPSPARAAPAEAPGPARYLRGVR